MGCYDLFFTRYTVAQEAQGDGAHAFVLFQDQTSTNLTTIPTQHSYRICYNDYATLFRDVSTGGIMPCHDRNQVNLTGHKLKSFIHGQRHGREQIHDVEKDDSFRNWPCHWIRVPRCINDEILSPSTPPVHCSCTRCTYHRDRVQCRVLRSVRHNHIVPPTCGRRRNPTFRPCLVSGRTIRQSPNFLLNALRSSGSAWFSCSAFLTTVGL